MMQIYAIPACIQNYIWILEDEQPNKVWVVDPGDGKLVQDWLNTQNKELAGILITHHHWDHVDGIEDLVSADTVVYGPGKNALPYTNHPLFHGDSLNINGILFNTLELPGHTQNHIAYLSEAKDGQPPMLFCGDILFSAGCGRLKDGTAEQLFTSLQHIKSLPDDTAIYCGHEYTLANLQFALCVEPSNRDAKAHQQHCEILRSQNKMTLPSTLKLEKLINPFLRSDQPEIMAQCKKHFHLNPKNALECFAALRKWKDNFV